MQTTTVRRLRWIAPFVAGAAIATAAILPGVAAGSDHPSLTPRSAAQLLADLATATTPALSGTIVETARLGLPDLPSTGAGTAELSLQNLITGSHSARVWLDGPQHQRVALVGDLAESDVVHNGNDLWIYASSANQATHVVLPAGYADAAKKAVAPTTIPTPAQVASEILASVTPTTRVTVDTTARVAGRPAYQIVLAPKDSHALITSVTIALDSATKMPLRVQVYGRDTATPAFETAFTDITFATPPASVFRFIPPTGAAVKASTPGELLGGMSGLGHQVKEGVGAATAPSTAGKTAGDTATNGNGRTRTIGSGWTAVLVTPFDLASLTGDGGANGAGRGTRTTNELESLLLHSATTVPGGRLITTALLSALITNDGHIYVGAVDGAALQQVAKTGQPA